jgi:amidase
MIERHGEKELQLNALISVSQQHLVLAEARAPEDECRAGVTRSPPHGIPIILRDAIITHAGLEMPATANSRAFLNIKATRNAAIVDILIDAGLTILGKANLTGFCAMVSPNIITGYSTVGGQTISPNVKGGIEKDETILGHSAPEGSSAGSVVAVFAR